MLLYGQIGSTLVERGICRTSNSPVGDVAEHLFSQCFGWELNANSKAGYDAEAVDIGRIQIKSRFLRTTKSSRQAGDIRNLDQPLFDHLAAVVFDADCRIALAFIAPRETVLRRSTYIKHTNSSRIYLRDDWLSFDGVSDVTARISDTWAALNP